MTIAFDGASGISASGNITGNYILGNGALLTGVATSNATGIANGTSNVSIAGANGNVTVGVNGTANVLVVSQTSAAITGNLIISNDFYIGNSIFTRTLTVGTRTVPVTVPLASNNSFNVVGRTGNITVLTT